MSEHTQHSIATGNVEAHFAEALEHHQAGRLEQAEHIYHEILAEDPNHAGSLRNVGLIAFQHGQIDHAAQLIGQALAVRPDWAEAYYDLGNLFKLQGKTDEAIAAYLQALELQPDHAATQNSLATTLAEQDHALPPPLQAAPSRIAYDACPLCGNTSTPSIASVDCSQHPMYQPTLPPCITWLRCSACEHVFTDGYFREEALAQLAAQHHPHQSVGHDAEQQRQLAAPMVERVARHVPPEGDWLDVGFGNAALLFTAEEWGYRPTGVDLHTDNVRALQQLGYEAYGTPLEELEFDGRFSVISLADVLEHMPFPRQALEAARRLLRPGGALLLSMPNMGSMAWRLLEQDHTHPYWGEIAHYHNFSRRRLYALLAELGFKPVDFNISQRYRLCMEVIAIKT